VFPPSLLTVADLDRAAMLDLLELARRMKARPEDFSRRLVGRSVAMIFQKSSTRTRVSFELGLHQLGGYAVMLSRRDMQLGRGETISDTARVLSRYVDGIVARVYAHADLQAMAKAATVPIVNGLSDDFHPCQALADYMTMQEIFGDLAGRTLAYVGDGNNMAASLALGGAIVGVSVRVASPAGYELPAAVLAQAGALAADSGATIEQTDDPAAAVTGADVVYTDVWSSMGQEGSEAQRRIDFQGYVVDDALMARASASAVFLHCLPLHRGEEVTATVADGPQSRIWDQAENRLHLQKAVLVRLLDRGAERDGRAAS